MSFLVYTGATLHLTCRSSCCVLSLPKHCSSRIRTFNHRRMQLMATPATDATVNSSSQQPAPDDPIVQYVVLRRDLWNELGWPLGPVIAQACHASSAAMFLHLEDNSTQQYIAAGNIDHMHKVCAAYCMAAFLTHKANQQLICLHIMLSPLFYSARIMVPHLQMFLWQAATIMMLCKSRFALEPGAQP